MGDFDLFDWFYACAGCSMSRAHCRSGFVPKNNCRSSLSITAAVGEAPGSATVKRRNCGGSGTGTTLSGTSTHMQWSNGTGTKYSGTGTPRLLEYQCTFGTGTTLTGTSTNMRSLQDLSGISIFVQGHARISITTSRSLMRIVFKPTLG